MPLPSRRTVAFQGELGAFSHVAALKLLGRKAHVLPCPSFRDVFDRLKSGSAALAVIPIENTLHGSVHENYDNLIEYNIPICGETNIQVLHQLIAAPGVPFRKIRRALSHPVALNQCRSFFLKHKQIEAVSFYDTAGSVKAVMESAPSDSAAIASETAAEIYGGAILRRNIQDNSRNFTRFFLLTKQSRPYTAFGSGVWKTSLAFSSPNSPGALFRALACFALRDLNLTKIESRPLRGKPWEYLFYVDLLGSTREKAVERALSNLREITQFCKVLGTYRSTP
ncbi:MAG: prephenate dehydratase [Acidobacteriales bacterium]|nr:prephenate dehydratase [Terriglobales bacterium]